MPADDKITDDIKRISGEESTHSDTCDSNDCTDAISGGGIESYGSENDINNHTHHEADVANISNNADDNVCVESCTENSNNSSAGKVSFIDRFSRPCKSRSNISMMLIAIAVIVSFASVYVAQAYDNDMWFIIASGKKIVESGIPMTNVFTWIPNLATVIQQWLPDVITYLAYSNFGIIGICTLVAIEIVLLIVSLLILSSKASGGKMHYETALILIAASIPALGSYISIRPQILTMIGITWTLIFLEAYRHTNNWKWLIGLPVTMIIHINCHMSMAPFDLFIIFLYLIPDVTKWLRSMFPLFSYSFRDSSYSRKPLLIAFLVTCLVTLLNPYGINGALYLLSSYGAADYGNYIKEMGALTPWDSDYGMGMILMTFIGAMAIGRNRRKINFPETVLLIVCTVLSYQHVRNVWLGALLTLPIAFQAFANVCFGSGTENGNPDPILADSIMWRTICGAFAAIAIVSCTMTSVSKADVNIDIDSTSTPRAAMDWLTTNNVSTDAKIFNHFNSGGYIEWRGYKTFIDARPELFEPAITGVNKHYYQEYVDTSTGKRSYSDMLNEYQFDFLIVNDDTSLYDDLISNRNYTDVCNGNGYAMFRRIGSTFANESNKSSNGNSSLTGSINSKQALKQSLPSLSKNL